jgi:hypothetical protein
MTEVEAVTQGGWREGNTAAEKIATAIAEKLAVTGGFDHFILQLIDNAAFCGGSDSLQEESVINIITLAVACLCSQ